MLNEQKEITMKLTDTKLYEVTVKYVSHRTKCVRVPKSYLDSYELHQLIEQAVYWEELSIPEYCEDDCEIVDVDINMRTDTEIEMYARNPYVTTEVLILQKDAKSNAEFLQVSEITDFSDVKKQ